MTNQNFSKIQKKKLKQMFANINKNNFSKSFDSFDLSKISSNSKSIFVDWKIEKIDYFDFHLFVNYDFESMIKKNKNIYYKNVNLFIKKIKNVIFIKNEFFVKLNLNICLKNAVIMWYIVEFTKFERMIFKQLNDQWIEFLKKRFKSN